MDTVPPRIRTFETAWYALCSWNREPPTGFTVWKRAGWPAIYFAIAVCVIAEGLPLHFFLHGLAAWLLTSLHVYTLLWLLADLQGMRLRPIQIDNGILHLRIGLRWEAEIPLEEIESTTSDASANPTAMRLGVLGTPNLILLLKHEAKLRGPFHVERSAKSLALQVDEPEALRRMLDNSAAQEASA